MKSILSNEWSTRSDAVKVYEYMASNGILKKEDFCLSDLGIVKILEAEEINELGLIKFMKVMQKPIEVMEK